jgi:hypothetical protein
VSIPAVERGGERLELVAYDGKLFTLTGARAFAPGNPLTLELALGIGHTLELKSIGSKKRPDGRFDVRARAATLTRGAREALAQAFPGSG